MPNSEFTLNELFILFAIVTLTINEFDHVIGTDKDLESVKTKISQQITERLLREK